jgi:lipopolysaccharide biosynthesis protein
MNDIPGAPAEVEFQRSSQTGAGQHLARLIAFYLPQFYPIPENDAWWGPGFTEWTNVAKARPLYKGHKQPRLPADLGFYDLRLAETRERQADMARAAGIEGFCYWHYWFGGGRRILERVFDEVLATGKPNYPFCLAWANQSWSRIWHGNPKHVLVEQTYPGPADFQAHFRAVLPRSEIRAI